jgi:hypothetical protein
LIVLLGRLGAFKLTVGKSFPIFRLRYPQVLQPDIRTGNPEVLPGAQNGVSFLISLLEEREISSLHLLRHGDQLFGSFEAYQRVLDEPKYFLQVQRVGGVESTVSSVFMFAGTGLVQVGKPSRHWVPAPNEFRFCIPRNPLIAMLRLRYEVSWFKLNNCMNLAGQHRGVPAYAAPTDTYSGLPVADMGSTAGLSAAARFVPTLYRYRVLRRASIRPARPASLLPRPQFRSCFRSAESRLP